MYAKIYPVIIMNKKINGDPKEKNSLQIFGQVGSLGITFVIIIGIFSFIGYRIDILFSTKPVFTCLGTLLGFIIALISIYQIIKKGNL